MTTYSVKFEVLGKRVSTAIHSAEPKNKDEVAAEAIRRWLEKNSYIGYTAETIANCAKRCEVVTITS